jgi:hypothetical protein
MFVGDIIGEAATPDKGLLRRPADATSSAPARFCPSSFSTGIELPAFL